PLAHAGVVPVSGATASGAAQALAPRRVALLIGVQDYGDPALAGLRFPDKDAADLGAVLQSTSLGGFDRVFIVQGAAATTGAAIRHAFDVATANLGRDDTFVLYLSGHGTLTLDPLEGSRLWFLPSDARLDSPELSGLAVADLEARVENLPSRRRVLILDTCHNGRGRSSIGPATSQLLSGLRGEIPAPRDVRDVSESEARLYAAQYFQPAMEDPTLGNGVYTHFLIEALVGGGADLDGDGLVDVAEAHEYSRDKTIAWTGGAQVPRAEYTIVGREDIYLSGPSTLRGRAERALVSATDSLFHQARLLVNGTARGVLPGLYALEPGLQHIEVQTADGRQVLDEHVRVRAGDTLAVEDMLQQRSAGWEVLGGADVNGMTGFAPLAPSAELVWVRPGAFTSGRWRPDLHVGASAVNGPGGLDSSGLDSSGLDTMMTGQGWLGATFAWNPGHFYVGPSADLRVPFRSVAASELLPDGWQEAGVAASGGLTLGASIPMRTGLSLALRADGWGGGMPWTDGWVPIWGVGLRVGVGG
ncbi:MAG: caspase family protein, partial [Myxococcales bacterium]|nr:caspase family protein [Myxococcales bacterium]